jgi:hypothetical protein
LHLFVGRKRRRLQGKAPPDLLIPLPPGYEAGVVGVPQVVPDIGGFKEFCTKDNSVLVKAKNRYYLPSAFSPVGGEAEACEPHDLCLGMEEYLLDSDKLKKHGEEARKNILGFTWEKVTESFVKRLKQEHEGDED